MDEHSLSANPLLHVANVLYLISYSLRDILWLRVLTVLAMLCLAWCYWCCLEYYALGWQAAFLAINLLQIGLLVLERRPVQLTDVQQKLHAGPLSTLTPRQVQRFTDKAEWSTVEAGKHLIVEDSRLEDLILLLSGKAKVVAKGQAIAEISDGQFVGEMSFLTGGETTADVIAVDSVLYAKWPEQYVHSLIQRDQELGTALQAALGSDLVRKLINSRST
ncbi:MAG: cyclic nucleotide-binding domain-containing protein [Pirellulaceae bacterium]